MNVFEVVENGSAPIRTEGTSVSPALSASEQAYLRVKEMILEGDLPAGDMITEGQISEELSLSRTPIREAFLRLEAEGWLKLFPKRGALVVPIQPNEMEQVFEARQLIETHAVRVVSQDAALTTALSRALTDVIAQMTTALADKDVEAFSSLDTEFHLTIVLAAENDILSDVYRGLRERLRRMTTRSVWHDQSRMERIIADHTELTRIIVDRDADGYSARLLEHMIAAHSTPAQRAFRFPTSGRARPGDWPS
ncbi:GntR family transcriptional regulator [Microbacterium sp. Re1]|uniref:GntR family transcriptional regulator n=1 Tax=Microbacterium commune TaxID=2762219 RepID=A0ABR8W5C4_9MICO|nr:GntR family transcriptional regulator [Microbacterium commune]